MDCAGCQAVTSLAGELMASEETSTEVVAFLQADFCLTGVPGPDTEFCVVGSFQM